jgi:hypothetical protein
MSRGYITFIIDGELKNSYNHDDSGPAHLGLHVLEWLRYADHAQVMTDIKNLKVVTEDLPPTEDQLRRLQERSSTESPEDQWYPLLRGTQGDPAAILAAGYTISNRDNAGYSLDAQWACAINADTRTLAAGNPELGAEWPWDNLPDDTTFLAACARLIPQLTGKSAEQAPRQPQHQAARSLRRQPADGREVHHHGDPSRRDRRGT